MENKEKEVPVTNGEIKKMKYCKCIKPKEWQGDNYCQECQGLIKSKLGNGGIADCPICDKPF